MLPVINEGVIYTRVSSNTQVKRGKGLQSQYFSCRRLAEERKIEIINNFEDPGISGKALYRPGLDKLINYLKERSSPTWVIIDDLDRLSRLDIYEYYYLKRQIQGFGGKLLSVNDDLEDESPINQLIENVKVSISQFQRRQNQERVNSRMRARLSSGYWMFHAPVGYLLENKMLTPDPHNAPLIKKLYKDFAAGKFQSSNRKILYEDDNVVSWEHCVTAPDYTRKVTLTCLKKDGKLWRQIMLYEDL